MKFRPRPLVLLLVVLALGAAVSWRARPIRGADPDPAPTGREAAYRFNNLGVALMEQFRFADGAEQFKKALLAEPKLAMAKINLALALFYVPDVPAARKEAEEAAALVPDAPQPRYLLALIARMDNRGDDAIANLKPVLQADPKDLGANLVLGQVYLQQRRFEEAVTAFRTAAAAEPYNVSAAYNLGVALTRGGEREKGAAQMAHFQELRESAYKTSFGQTYMEQGRYAETVSSTGAEADLVDPKTPPVTFTEAAGMAPAVAASSATPALLGRSLKTAEVPAAIRAGGRAALTIVDLDGDGALGAIDVRGGVLRVLRNSGGRLSDATPASGLASVEGRAVVAGDYDNDGKPDLLVLKPGALALFHNEGGGRFKDATAAAQLPAYPHVALSAAFVDIDHDGDLDVFVAGLADLAATKETGRPLLFPTDFAPAPSLLLQNNGNGTFTDITARAKVGAPGHAIAVAPTDFDNRRDIDLLVLRYDAPPVLFKNLRDGSFADVAADVGLTARGPFLSLAAADVNKDGFTDFFLGTATGPSLLALSDGRIAFKLQPAPDGTGGTSAAQLMDYDADGVLDLVAATSAGLRVYRNLGGTFADVSTVAEALRSAPLDGAALGFADLDLDGDEDALVETATALRYLRNDGGNTNRSFPVRLAGRVTNKNGVGAKVDIRAGSLRQKIETTATSPAVAPADVLFGLGRRTAPDALRVVWVSGIVQTETEFPAPTAAGPRTAMDVTELDRKPSSCPYLYAWNGERFEFVTDFLGGGEMGYWLAPGLRNHPDPEEYIRIRSDQLREKDGRYELRATNELEEVLYLDRMQLLAVAHPADVQVFPDEGMTEPPKEHRLFAVRDAAPPPAATDDTGRDVRERVARLDRRFVEGFGLHRIRGYADEHALVLDLAGLPADRTLLLLTGWTDYAFSSDNVAAHQAGLAMKAPALQVQDASGAWQTVIESIGIPVGRPQTIVVDLAGKWRGESRRVRVVTNMRIYWDQVLVGAPAKGLPLAPVPLDPVRADLAERGFSAEVSPDGREPWSYDFARTSAVSPWKTAPGRYTRTGDVRDLLTATDDVFVVSKPGDVVALSFDARALPPLPKGWTRTFLLHGDGFSKEMDVNSSSPDEVLPLPFHGMPSYPYERAEAPERLRKAAERAELYNTRAVFRPLYPIELAAVAR
jgi:tetratricopeptide (TPR) repeat protein